ncbi:MAG: hypothetical protein R3C11_10500 [Planctomycetaceae bacterium]
MIVEDQATALRALTEQYKQQQQTPAIMGREALTLAVTGGKGESVAVGAKAQFRDCFRRVGAESLFD